MPSSPPNPQREPGRHYPVHWPGYEDGNQSTIVYVTICTQNRKRILAQPDAVAAIRKAWLEADAWTIGRYVILPDHLHLFCSPRRSEISLKQWISFWKSRASQRWPRATEHPIWQRDFWDTQLRREESYAEKWEYVRNNPVRHNLVKQADAWPWSGEIEVLTWHEA